MIYNEDFDIQLDKKHAKLEVKMSKKVVKNPRFYLKKDTEYTILEKNTGVNGRVKKETEKKF